MNAADFVCMIRRIAAGNCSAELCMVTLARSTCLHPEPSLLPSVNRARFRHRREGMERRHQNADRPTDRPTEERGKMIFPFLPRRL